MPRSLRFTAATWQDQWWVLSSGLSAPWRVQRLRAEGHPGPGQAGEDGDDDDDDNDDYEDDDDGDDDDDNDDDDDDDDEDNGDDDDDDDDILILARQERMVHMYSLYRDYMEALGPGDKVQALYTTVQCSVPPRYYSTVLRTLQVAFLDWYLFMDV